MGVLRFLWAGVLAFDRVGRRIPQLIQIWLCELLFVMPLAFFIGKVIDIRGAFGVPGTGGSIPGVFWGALAVAAVAGAAHVAVDGDTVLLSPACASFDMFRNYAHRAEVFVATVQALAADRGEMAS